MRYYAGVHHEETLQEELASAFTHAIGLALAIAASVLMLHHATVQGDVWHVVTLAVFGSTLVAEH